MTDSKKPMPSSFTDCVIEFADYLIDARESELDRLRARLMMIWHPIETIPRDGTAILITDGKRVGCAVFVNERFCWADGNGEAIWSGDSEYGGFDDVGWEISHWMPLPDPPQH